MKQNQAAPFEDSDARTLKEFLSEIQNRLGQTVSDRRAAAGEA